MRFMEFSDYMVVINDEGKIQIFELDSFGDIIGEIDPSRITVTFLI